MCNHCRFSLTRSLHLSCQVTRTRDLIDLDLGDVPASTSGGKRSFLAKVTLFLDIAFAQLLSHFSFLLTGYQEGPEPQCRGIP